MAEIRFGKPPGQGGGIRRGSALERVLRDPPRQALHALGLRAVAPQLLVEQDRVEPRDAALERRFAIRVPEEAGIAQPRREHALGVAGNHLGFLRLHVGNRQKPGPQRPGLVGDRKPVLMMDHRRRQHLLRQLEKLRPEVAGDDGRIFEEIRHLVEQA